MYHSSFVDEEGITKACGCPLLPLKSHIKGPAPVSNQGWIYVLSASLGSSRNYAPFLFFELIIQDGCMQIELILLMKRSHSFVPMCFLETLILRALRISSLYI